MNHQRSFSRGSVLSNAGTPRVAVIGGGIGGLSCARELRLHGHDPVVFEAGDRLGGRCSSRNTPIGCFDDGAQAIGGVTNLASYAAQRPGELAALHPWTVPATPSEDEPTGKRRDKYEDEEELSRSLKPMGAVGVPSMLALARAMAQPLDVRLNTPIQQAWKRGGRWVLRDAEGEVDEDFDSLVLALPAPLALPLAWESPALSAALQAVRFRSRWVLMLGSERAVGLPGYREFQGSPIERVAAMHSKPGRAPKLPQRWFVEADERWSLQHDDDDAETVAELLLDIFCAHAGRAVTPSFLCAHQWRHAFVEAPAAAAGHSECLWDEALQLGVCGDSVVASRVELVHRSGLALALRMAEAGLLRRERSVLHLPERGLRTAFEPQALHV